MKFSRMLILLAPLLLTACGLSPQQKADYASVQSSGVNSAVYDKMVHNDPLSLYDIKALAQAHVRDAVTLRYLRDHGTIYYLNTNDVEDLRKAGVSQSVIDYMLDTPRLYQQVVYPYPIVDVGFGYGPGWWGPGPYYGHRHWR